MPGSASTTSVTPWRSANSRSRSTELSARRTRSTSSTRSQRAAALDAGEVQQLVDHLDEVAGLHLDPGDAVPHPGRDVVGLRLAGQRLRQEADRGQRRAELVAQVVDERGPDVLEAAELGDVLQDHQQARRVGTRGAQGDDGPLRLALTSARRPPCRRGGCPRGASRSGHRGRPPSRILPMRRPGAVPSSTWARAFARSDPTVRRPAGGRPGAGRRPGPSRRGRGRGGGLAADARRRPPARPGGHRLDRPCAG